MDASVKTSLRERQKYRRRAGIINAARSLFNEHGYTATSMDMIAGLAEVGIATVYNYFGTKGRLLAEILAADFAALYEAGEQLLARASDDPTTGVLSLIDIYRGFQDNWQRKDLLSAVLGPGLSADPALDQVSIDAETRVKQQLEMLLSGYQRAGKIRSGIDLDDAALIIFYIFNQHFIEFVSGDSASLEQMRAAMDRQIRFIVSAIRVET